MKKKKKKKNSNNNEDIKNIVLVNFKNKKVSKFTISPFGIETIFGNIYYFLSNSLKELEKIREWANDVTENKDISNKNKEDLIKMKLKKNIFFENFISFEDKEKEKEEKARSVIRYQTFYAGVTGLFPIVDIAGNYYIKRSLNNQIAKIYGFDIEQNQNVNKKKITDEIEDNDDLITKKKDAEKEIIQNTQSSLSNTGKTAVGVLAGNLGNYFLDTAVSGASSLVGYGLRFATSLALMGGQIAIGVGLGGYKMYQNGEEILKIYKSKFYEKRYESLISDINNYINAINYFKIISEGFEELNSEKGEIKRKENKFDITIILEKYKDKIEVDIEEPNIKEEDNLGFEIID